MSAIRPRAGLPFRRIAVVLSGGGALGAYEVGVLRVIEAAGLAPWLVAGVSIGAVNAVVWLAHGGRTAALEEAWRSMRASTIGLRWGTLAMRAAGAAIMIVALLELLLAVMGSRALSGSWWLWRRWSGRADLSSGLLDATAWAVLALAGALLVAVSRPAEGWLARLSPPADPQRLHRRFGLALLALAAVHATVWVFGWPWPHRFSAFTLLVLGGAWLANRPGRAGDRMRGLLRRLMPETRGRGLWGSAARRQVIERLVRAGDPQRLASGPTGLLVSALATDTGRVAHFTRLADPDPALAARFAQRVERELGEVLPIRDAEDAVRAAVASSAIPGLFEPVRIAGRDFVDAGGLTNQPIHLAIAAESDAVLVVLLSPSGSPPPAPPSANLLELAARLLELSNWRDLQAELRALPDGWSREGRPARVCVVEPAAPLPGGVLGFAPESAAQLMRLGAADAEAALARAGWIEPAVAAGAARAAGGAGA
uniref:PNPLA domain-containing protein n=1 Tax=Eiseniibacteriota bacterium TaxID=2212470 RepID=A0A832I1D5_UNCEI